MKPEPCITTPKPIPGIKVSKIACGYSFCILAGINGELYVMGVNVFNRLGPDSSVVHTTTPVLLENVPTSNIVDIVCYRSIACISDGIDVYMWGAGSGVVKCFPYSSIDEACLRERGETCRMLRICEKDSFNGRLFKCCNRNLFTDINIQTLM